jgi:hypothetical protein
MVRYEIDNYPIKICYGHDQVTGFFLSVYDARLKWNADASKEVNDVTEKVGVRDGGGSYFDLHTGHGGFGFKVP